jgi:hypothetical protein
VRVVTSARPEACPARGRPRGTVVRDEALCNPHELSIPMTGPVGAARGDAPRSKISMRRMRPPRQGQALAGFAGAWGSSLDGAGGGGGGSSARALARLAARAMLAKRP